jgi:hypothetical protein
MGFSIYRREPVVTTDTTAALIAEAREKIERAKDETIRLVKESPRMSIPANPARDTDLILMDALKAADDLMAALESVGVEATTREKLAAEALTFEKVRAVIWEYMPTADGEPDSLTIANALFDEGILVDANKVAADAWDEGQGEGTVAALNFTPLPPNPYRAPVTAPTETEKP